MATIGFLSDFPPVSTADWERAIRETVLDKDYAAKLIWHPEEGLEVRPYYRSEDLRGLHFLEAPPGQFPYARSSRVSAGWRIREEICASVPEDANRLALEAIRAGAEEIEFSRISIEDGTEFCRLLENLNGTPVRFCGMDLRTGRLLSDWLHAYRPSRQISADIDPLADLAFTAEMCSAQIASRIFTISAEEYAEKGAGAIEQIAFALSAAVAFFDAMLERGIALTSSTERLGFSFTMGSHFLVEVAKLRAFRFAWARLVELFGAGAESAKAAIYTRNSRWNETIYDSPTNVLRSTTEAMSAVLGGADSHKVDPYDSCYRMSDEASRRLARNVQLILKQEADFAHVTDPLGGAYAIEALTNSIALQAWRQFQELETAGGYRKANSDGLIQSTVDRRSAKRDALANHRKLVLTGVNRFADPTEKLPDGVSQCPPDDTPRVARRFERIRMQTQRWAEKHALPVILLAEFGDAKSRGLRAQFASEFLACAGLASDRRCVQTPLDVGEANADLIVLCSSDSEYLPFAEALVPMLIQLDTPARVVIAGNPGSAQQLKEIGIEDFIYQGCDAAEVLEKIQQKLGIES